LISLILNIAKDPGSIASIKTRSASHNFPPDKPAVTPRSFAALRMTEKALSRSYVASTNAPLYHIRRTGRNAYASKNAICRAVLSIETEQREGQPQR